MKLDTHLYNLVAQFIQAHGDLPEQHRLQDVALKHLQNRTQFMQSPTQILRCWALLIDAFGIED